MYTMFFRSLLHSCVAAVYTSTAQYTDIHEQAVFFFFFWLGFLFILRV